MKYAMRLSLLAASLLLFLINCSKPDDFTADYLRGKMDGVDFECTNIRAHKPMPIPGSGDDPTLLITGNWPSNSIKLNIHSEGGAGNSASINEGEYVFQADKNRSAEIWHSNVDVYYAGNGGGLGVPIYLVGSGRITIHQINKNYIKGSFEFTTSVNGTTGFSNTISNGEFYVKRS